MNSITNYFLIKKVKRIVTFCWFITFYPYRWNYTLFSFVFTFESSSFSWFQEGEYHVKKREEKIKDQQEEEWKVNFIFFSFMKNKKQWKGKNLWKMWGEKRNSCVYKVFFLQTNYSKSNEKSKQYNISLIKLQKKKILRVSLEAFQYFWFVLCFFMIFECGNIWECRIWERILFARISILFLTIVNIKFQIKLKPQKKKTFLCNFFLKKAQWFSKYFSK